MSDTPKGGRFDAIVARLHALHPRAIDLSLGRLEALLARLDHPERRLPPVIHVAGTNGKGSTCAFLRAFGEAAGLRVHVYTSPHLVAFNERIRLAGRLVDDDTLAATLADVEQVNDGAAITVFEIITAVAFMLFARVPAELCVLEVGLGGRLDATNVIPPAAAGAITSISFDHRDWLGETLPLIAREKAGIIKPGMTVATGAQPPEVFAVVQAAADAVGARLLARGRDWVAEPTAGGLRFEDAGGVLHLPRPSLPGGHQVENAGIALAALRATALPVPAPALAYGIAHADWPARLQRLTGRLAAALPAGWDLWLDGGHNAGAGEVLAAHLAGWHDRPLHLVVGMKRSKDAGGFLRPLLPHATTLWAVAEPGQHLAQPVEDIVAASGGAARVGPTIAHALAALPRSGLPARVLICGSLYLAGEVLKADGL
jgi:dihydrofolate synthase/folylpolyglutamate synthase